MKTEKDMIEVLDKYKAFVNGNGDDSNIYDHAADMFEVLVDIYNKQKRKVNITFESVTRIGETYEITNEEYDDMILTEELPESIYKDLVDKVMHSCESEYDYAVEDEDGKKVIDWN